MKRQSDIGWFELIMGLILIILGIVIMRQPVGVLTWIVILCGVIAVISGIGDIVLYVKMERFTGFGPVVSLVTGILGIMAGFMLIAHPGAGTWAIAMILPIWIIAHCISRLSHFHNFSIRIDDRKRSFQFMARVCDKPFLFLDALLYRSENHS